MENAWAIWTGLGGMAIATIASSFFWSWRNRLRAESEAEALSRAIPGSRDGYIVSALAIELRPVGSGPAGWFADLIPALDELVEKHGLKRVGAFHGTYMVVGTDQKVASTSLTGLAQTALDLRDCVQLFAAMREVPLSFGCGIHADIVPTVGIGSTVALSQLWSEALSLADQAKDGNIELSPNSAEWLGSDFNVMRMGEKPVLHTRKAA